MTLALKKMKEHRSPVRTFEYKKQTWSEGKSLGYEDMRTFDLHVIILNYIVCGVCID